MIEHKLINKVASMRKSKKTRQCNIRITPEFMLRLEDCADACGITVSEYVRIKMGAVVARNYPKLPSSKSAHFK